MPKNPNSEATQAPQFAVPKIEPTMPATPPNPPWPTRAILAFGLNRLLRTYRFIVTESAVKDESVSKRAKSFGVKILN